MAGTLIGQGSLSDPEQDRRVAAVVDLATQITALAPFDGNAQAAADLQRLQAETAALQMPFTLVALGEFSAGKSSLLNTLLGADVLPEGALPTTDAITWLTYGAAAQQPLDADGVRRCSHPAPLLQRLTLVDTPGAHVLEQFRTTLLQQVLPRADLILFVTAADRPLTGHELGLLQLIRSSARRVVLVLNRIDRLLPGEEARVEEYVRTTTRRVLGGDVPYCAVVAQPRNAARIEPLQRYLVSALTDPARLKARLRPPLSTAQRLLSTAQIAEDRRLAAPSADLDVLARFERHVTDELEAVSRETDFALHAADQVVTTAAERGQRLLHERLRLRALPALLDQHTFSRNLVQQVSSDLQTTVEPQFQKLVDCLAEPLPPESAQLRQRAVAYGLASAESAEPPPPDRAAVQQAVTAAVQQGLAAYDQPIEAVRLAAQVRESLAIGVLGVLTGLVLALVLLVILQTWWLDLGALLLAGGLVALGWAYLSYQRRVAQTHLRAQFKQLHRQLSEQIRALTAREIQRRVQLLQTQHEPLLRAMQQARRQAQQRVTTIRTLLEQARRLVVELDVQLKREG